MGLVILASGLLFVTLALSWWARIVWRAWTHRAAPYWGAVVLAYLPGAVAGGALLVLWWLWRS